MSIRLGVTAVSFQFSVFSFRSNPGSIGIIAGTPMRATSCNPLAGKDAGAPGEGWFPEPRGRSPLVDSSRYYGKLKTEN